MFLGIRFLIIELVLFICVIYISATEPPSMSTNTTLKFKPNFVPLPTLLPKLPSSSESKEKPSKRQLASMMQVPILVNKAKNKWGDPLRDTSYADQLERERLAEIRRAKAQEMLEKMKKKNKRLDSESDEDVSLDDYSWLSKYCILPRSLEGMFKKTFDEVDEEGRGWLSPLDTILALRATNRQLTEAQEEYIYRILHLTGYDICAGTDFRLFAIIAALAQKITSLEDWMKNIMASVDFKVLDMRLFMCKTLWECNVDENTNTIPIDQLCIELRAGGVSYEHELEVRDKLKHLRELDLLDFLAYIPLFIMLHNSIVENPLNDKRTK